MNIYPNSNENNEIVFVGFGLSTALLVISLLKQGFKKKILILEKSLCVNENKIWCFWNNKIIPNYIKDIIDYEWNGWSVSYDGKVKINNSAKDNQYMGIKSKTFFDFAKEIISNHENVKIRYESDVTYIKEENELLSINCKDKIFTTKYCFDSRYERPIEKHLSQDFLGLWVECDDVIFDYEITGLMLDLKFHNGITFDYILPVSKNKFLIEFTRFTEDDFDLAYLEKQVYSSLRKYLDDKNFKIINKEFGSLPLNPLNKPKNSKRIKYSGIASGNIRGSTGYSFLINCRWAESMTKQIMNQKYINIDPIPLTYRILDSLFLKVINEEKNNGPEIFYSFFDKNSSNDISDFLSEKMNIFLILRIIINMPKKISFLKALFKKILYI